MVKNGLRSQACELQESEVRGTSVGLASHRGLQKLPALGTRMRHRESESCVPSPRARCIQKCHLSVSTSNIGMSDRGLLTQPESLHVLNAYYGLSPQVHVILTPTF